ncbi:MAG: hypothetical protein ACJ763_00935 [Bdellovibrionia bacterium]
MWREIQAVSLLYLFFFVGMGQAFASRGECSLTPLSSWINVKAQPPVEPGSIKAFSQWEQREYDARVESSREVYREYFSGQLDTQSLGQCLSAQPDRGMFYATLQSVFFDQSIEKLRSSKSPAIRNFLHLIDAKYPDLSRAMFRITGHFKEASPTDLKGGFHRATGSIFMDFDRVTPSEWLVIFCHELLHSLDEKLWEAVRAYSQPELVKSFAEWSNDIGDVSQLSRDQKQSLTSWIDAGLGRGLWAEYRAWVPTFQIYLQGKSEGLWPEIDWMETVLESRKQGETFERSLYSYIDEHSADPTDGIFSRPLIQSALRSERAKVRNAKAALPELGSLGSVR